MAHELNSKHCSLTLQLPKVKCRGFAYNIMALVLPAVVLLYQGWVSAGRNLFLPCQRFKPV